ncbi:MAG: 4Fe-4S cluster-binding domain-containing protein [Eubacteriales bacterium]|nr:4Fe-4S cluster-binding domain-containing protein [Eubacteriales bacterium]
MEFQCNLCPRKCNATRGETGNGFCGMGSDPVLARAAPHFDEEPVISGVHGSGAVFFSGCCLRCRFCQNYEISTENFGKRVSPETLRKIYFRLIDQGVHNINLVNPTHFTRAILQSLEGGLPVPVVWNTGGYERVETLRALEGKVQVYLPDLKYYHADAAGRYSAAPDYFPYASAAIREMLRQTGPAQIDENGLMVRGTMVRHLILPGRTQESMEILRWIRENLPGAWVSLMAQYVPAGDANGVDQLGRQLTQQEYDRVADCLMELGLEDGFVQELSSSDEKYIPNFDLTGVLDEWN